MTVSAKPFRPKEKLVLTLLVKNEADIIVDNIFFHYSKGVDHIIVTDNGSDDGTLDILRQLQNEGLIYLLEDKLYHQDRMVNKMGEIAKEKFGATILIHCDADEFWSPSHGKNLKKAFIKIKKPAVLVNRHDVLPTPLTKNNAFPQASMNIVKKHLESSNIEKDSEKISLFLYKLPPKVMFSVKDGLEKVGTGNHNLTQKHSGRVTDNIVIFHFPFKSADRFKEKVIIAGQAMEKIKTTPETFWHWKRWYNEYKAGRIDQEIELLIPDLKTIRGIEFEEFNYNKKVIKAIKKNRKLRRLYIDIKATNGHNGKI